MTRVSTDREIQAKSLESQESMLIRYISDHGWTLHEIYTDRITGTHDIRPGFRKLVEDAKAKKFDVIIAKELSRLVRNIALSEELKKIILTNDLHIVTLDGAINTLEEDVSKYGLFAWLYEDESRRTSNRIKSSFSEMARKGRYTRGEAPFGYEVDDGKLIIRDDETPNVVRQIYKLYIDGHGTEFIARRLTEEGYQTPAMLKGKKNAGVVWHGSTVMLILKNRHYIGDLEQGKESTKDITIKGRKKSKETIVVEGTHEPIISKSDYYCVQEMLKKRSRKSIKRATPKKHLFSDKIYCKDCSKKLWYVKPSKAYFCGTYKKQGTKYCSKHKIKESELLDVLRADLKEYASSMKNKEDNYKELESRVKKQSKEHERLKKSYEKKKAKFKKDKGSLILKYTGGEITKLEYDLASEVLDGQMVDLERQMMQIEKAKSVEESVESFERLVADLEQFLTFEEITRDTINRFVDRIVVHEDEICIDICALLH